MVSFPLLRPEASGSSVTCSAPQPLAATLLGLGHSSASGFLPVRLLRERSCCVCPLDRNYERGSAWRSLEKSVCVRAAREKRVLGIYLREQASGLASWEGLIEGGRDEFV